MLGRLKSINRRDNRHKDQEQKISFAQSGEDLIIDYIFKNHLGVESPSYLDIGAYDPIVFSNTYLFYLKGGHGVLVEPDPDLAQQLRQNRSKDTVLNVGVSRSNSQADFYLVTPPTLNTFSKKEYDQYKLFYPGTQLRKVIKVKTLSLNKLLNKYFAKGLDILSIDVEGLDFELLSSIDFSKYRPKVICIETVRYEEGNTWVKPKNIPALLYENSYFLYADTFINTIFVDQKAWSANNQPLLKNFNGRS